MALKSSKIGKELKASFSDQGKVVPELVSEEEREKAKKFATVRFFMLPVKMNLNFLIADVGEKGEISFLVKNKNIDYRVKNAETNFGEALIISAIRKQVLEFGKEKDIHEGLLFLTVFLGKNKKNVLFLKKTGTRKQFMEIANAWGVAINSPREYNQLVATVTSEFIKVLKNSGFAEIKNTGITRI